MKKRVKIELYGRVQGVNMRARVKMTALSLTLFGFVKNREDGSVEIVAEGEEENLHRLIEWLKNLHGHEKIESLKDDWSEAIHEFIDFSIRY